MANESNILSASIELSLRSIQKGAKAIQQTVDNVNSAADFAQVKNEFSSLANRVVQAATTIQTEIGKITNTIDLSQVARNLQSLDTNVGKIVGSIDSYMEKMADSMADVNKVKLTEVQDQLADLQNSIKKFSALIQSEDFLKAFKSDDIDLFPIEVFKEKRVKRFEMAYVAESYYGDTLSFYREEVGEGEYDIEVRKNGTEVVVRSKVILI